MPTGEHQNANVLLVADFTNHPATKFIARRRGLEATGLRIICSEWRAIALADSLRRGGDILDHCLLKAGSKTGDNLFIVLGEIEPDQALSAYLPCFLFQIGIPPARVL